MRRARCVDVATANRVDWFETTRPKSERIASRGKRRLLKLIPSANADVLRKPRVARWGLHFDDFETVFRVRVSFDPNVVSDIRQNVRAARRGDGEIARAQTRVV